MEGVRQKSSYPVLEACPHCGGAGKYFFDGEFGTSNCWVKAGCLACGCRTAFVAYDTFVENEDRAVQAAAGLWNKRVESRPPEEKRIKQDET